MSRPKGIPNKKIAQVESITKTEKEVEAKVVFINREEMTKDILLSIVDALYDKDGDAATWKPIRDEIEALL